MTGHLSAPNFLGTLTDVLFGRITRTPSGIDGAPSPFALPLR